MQSQASGDLYHRWVTYCFLKRAMLSFHYLPANTGLDVKPSPEQLETRVKRLLVVFGKYTGHYIPMEGVLAPEKRADGYTGWPHVHLVLQEPLVKAERLISLGRAMWLKVTYSNHPAMRDKEHETDLREYVAGHMERHGAVYLPGQNVITNRAKLRAMRQAGFRVQSSRPQPNMQGSRRLMRELTGEDA